MWCLHSSSMLFVLLSLVAVVEVRAFAPPNHQHRPSSTRLAPRRRRVVVSAATLDNDVDVEKWWTYLTEDGGVQMCTISESPSSDGLLPSPVNGKEVVVEYVGMIASRDWSVEDVNACWTPHQGLGPMAPDLFKAHNINGKKLMDPDSFSKKLISTGLGLKKHQTAKMDSLHAAARALNKHDESHPPGTVFDKNRFTFKLGSGNAIKAFELALVEMKPGQTVSVWARSDYAYGKNGVEDAATSKVVVPPYATVEFDLTLIEVK